MTADKPKSSEMQSAPPQSSHVFAPEPSTTEHGAPDIESLPRALAAILVAMAVVAIMSAMLNQYIAVELLTQVQTWFNDRGSTSGIASTVPAPSATAAHQGAAERDEGGPSTINARSPKAGGPSDTTGQVRRAEPAAPTAKTRRDLARDDDARRLHM